MRRRRRRRRRRRQSRLGMKCRNSLALLREAEDRARQRREQHPTEKPERVRVQSHLPRRSPAPAFAPATRNPHLRGAHTQPLYRTLCIGCTRLKSCYCMWRRMRIVSLADVCVHSPLQASELARRRASGGREWKFKAQMACVRPLWPGLPAFALGHQPVRSKGTENHQRVRPTIIFQL